MLEDLHVALARLLQKNVFDMGYGWRAGATVCVLARSYILTHFGMNPESKKPIFWTTIVFINMDSFEVAFIL